MTDHDFEYLGEPEPDRADITFKARFEGEMLSWQATVMTLSWYARQESPRRATANRQFIDMQTPKNGTCRVSVGLCVDRIDPQVLMKTVIMLRQYKRLRPGRHEYGEPCNPQGNSRETS